MSGTAAQPIRLEAGQPIPSPPGHPFRQYAEQALRQAVQSKNEKEQLALIELVRNWTQAAEASSQGAALENRAPFFIL